MRYVIIIFFIPLIALSEEVLECKTQKHIGLNFLGKDYEKILNRKL